MLLVDYFTVFNIFLHFLLIDFIGIDFTGGNMANMAEARRKMHDRDEKIKNENKSEVKKIRNFLFGCCNNKESKKVKEHK